jgi:HEAT repeat protein
MEKPEDSPPEPIADRVASESSSADQIAQCLCDMDDDHIASLVAANLSGLLREADPLPPTVIPALLEKLRYDDRTAEAARSVLRDIGPPALQALISSLRCADPWLRGHFAFAIGRFGAEGKAALPPLKELLQDPDRHVRVHAAIAVWEIDGKTREIARIVMEGFRSYHELAWKAARYLREMGPEASEVVPELIQILQSHEDGWWKWHAAVALGGMGLAAVPAIPSLIEATQSSDDDVSWHAYFALGGLRALARVGELILTEFEGGPNPPLQQTGPA